MSYGCTGRSGWLRQRLAELPAGLDGMVGDPVGACGPPAVVVGMDLFAGRLLMMAESRILSFARRLVRPSRAGRAVTAAAVALALSACGGGGEDSTSFSVTVVSSGRHVGTVQSGERATTIYVPVNSSFELDASEPVSWTLYVGNTAVTGNSTVIYGDLEVDVTALTASRVAIDTYSRYALSQSVPITMVATSTYDAVQVATAYVYITN